MINLTCRWIVHYNSFKLLKAHNWTYLYCLEKEIDVVGEFLSIEVIFDVVLKDANETLNTEYLECRYFVGLR